MIFIGLQADINFYWEATFHIDKLIILTLQLLHYLYEISLDIAILKNLIPSKKTAILKNVIPSMKMYCVFQNQRNSGENISCVIQYWACLWPSTVRC